MIFLHSCCHAHWLVNMLAIGKKPLPPPVNGHLPSGTCPWAISPSIQWIALLKFMWLIVASCGPHLPLGFGICVFEAPTPDTKVFPPIICIAKVVETSKCGHINIHKLLARLVPVKASKLTWNRGMQISCSMTTQYLFLTESNTKLLRQLKSFGVLCNYVT